MLFKLIVGVLYAGFAGASLADQVEALDDDDDGFELI